MNCAFNHGQSGNIIVDPKNIMETAVIITYIRGAALQNFAVRSFHQISGVIPGLILCLVIIMPDHIKNRIGRSVSDPSVCHMSVFNIHDRIFRILCFQIMNDYFAVRAELTGNIVSNLFQYSKPSHSLPPPLLLFSFILT